ncbi:hypothetical protein pb186bvf_010005 [Paramecium bursaria]
MFLGKGNYCTDSKQQTRSFEVILINLKYFHIFVASLYHHSNTKIYLYQEYSQQLQKQKDNH